jgi:FtsX-like permease family protein
MTVVARADGVDASTLAANLRAAVHAVDPDVPLYGIATMEERRRGTIAVTRFHTMLLATVGAIGLVLAAVGIYGVIAYFAASRTQEIGVRMALGASARDIVRLVAWQGMRPILVGTAAGTIAAACVTRLVRGRGVRRQHHGPGYVRGRGRHSHRHRPRGRLRPGAPIDQDRPRAGASLVSWATRSRRPRNQRQYGWADIAHELTRLLASLAGLESRRRGYRSRVRSESPAPARDVRLDWR